MNLKPFGRVVVEIFDYQGGQLGIPGPRPCLDRALVPRVNVRGAVGLHRKSFVPRRALSLFLQVDMLDRLGVRETYRLPILLDVRRNLCHQIHKQPTNHMPTGLTTVSLPTNNTMSQATGPDREEMGQAIDAA